MSVSRPTYQLAAGTHLITDRAGFLTMCVGISDGTNDVTIDCHDCAATGDIATTNQLVTFKIDGSLVGFTGGGAVPSLRFGTGLVVKVTGTNGVAYVGYSR